MEPLLTRAEAARAIKKKESWLRYAELHRLIAFIKVGQQIRYRTEDLVAWINSRRVAPKSESATRRAGERRK